MARTWPTSLPYMTGDERHLDLELLIGLDNLSHSFQKLLNVNNIDHSPKLEYREYHADKEPLETVPHESSKPPPMGVQPLYHQAVLHSMTSTDEEYRKYPNYKNKMVFKMTTFYKVQ